MLSTMAPPRLEIRNIKRFFDGRPVVDDVSLQIQAGQVTCLLGPSGCGKSTVLTMAAGLNPISKGAIRLDGWNVQGADPERAVVFQSPNLFPWLSAKENVAIGVDKVYPRASQAERQDVVEYYLERVGLADSMDKQASGLSNGMRQRVGIARAFALSPKLLLLDEPFAALGPALKAEMLDLVADIATECGATLLMVSHDPQDARRIAEQVILVAEAVVSPPAPTAMLLDNPPPALRAYLGSDAGD